MCGELEPTLLDGSKVYMWYSTGLPDKPALSSSSLSERAPPPDVLEALTLLFADYVKMATPRTQNIRFHSSLTAVWD